jgi:glycerol-3-phosphate dehydrogenase
MQEEIEFILKHIGRYLSKDPQLSDVRSMFAGLRPLIKGKSKKTAALSRDHIIVLSGSGLISIAGGKWTTYRKMAEDAVDYAIKTFDLSDKPCETKELKLYGHDKEIPANEITSMSGEELKAAIKKTVAEEMCMTVEDLVAKIMAEEMNKDDNWIKEQIDTFNAVAKNYAPTLNI